MTKASDNQAKINTNQTATNLDTDVSIKELFERVVTLETKLDMMSLTNAKSTSYFKYLAVLIIAVQAANFALNIVGLYLLLWR